LPYKPIADYGLIGDMHTAALVARDGSIDWLCLPDFDSPSVFAALLDNEKGGYFRISPSSGDHQTRQFYFPGSNVLITRFTAPDSVIQIADFMLVHDETVSGDGQFEKPRGRTIVRHVTGVQGTSQLRLECCPRFNYARASHEIHHTPDGVVFRSERGPAVSLACGDYHIWNEGVVSEFTLSVGESKTFVLAEVDGHSRHIVSLTPEQGETAFRATAEFWRRWLSRCTYRGRWREVVHRSALTLKLLTYQPTGAIVAAPTTSLPETIGGVRNWDYRYTWVRDAAFTLYGFMRIGLTDEARAFTRFIGQRAREPERDTPLQIMYGIRGEHELNEETLDHLEGYKGSRPVRIGNGAYGQLQLDIYGELMDSIYLYNKYGSPISYSLWQEMRRILNWVTENWDRPDEGIWEVRGGRQHFVYSKLMSWVALDRGARLADRRSFPSDRERWLKERDRIYEEIMARGWNERMQSFVQCYDSDVLDASVLLMPLVFFLAPRDPMLLSTIKAIERNLTRDSLVSRYDVQRAAPDGLAGEEGTFTMCTFWLVEALTRSGRLDDARFLFERMLNYANHLGLYSEEIGSSGELLGNFPQAFTHLGLISAAFNLDRALGEGV